MKFLTEVISFVFKKKRKIQRWIGARLPQVTEDLWTPINHLPPVTEFLSSNYLSKRLLPPFLKYALSSRKNVENLFWMEVASSLDASSTGRDCQKIRHSTTVEPWLQISLVAKIASGVAGSTSPTQLVGIEEKSAKTTLQGLFKLRNMEYGMNSSWWM